MKFASQSNQKIYAAYRLLSGRDTTWDRVRVDSNAWLTELSFAYRQSLACYKTTRNGAVCGAGSALVPAAYEGGVWNLTTRGTAASERLRIKASILSGKHHGKVIAH